MHRLWTDEQHKICADMLHERAPFSVIGARLGKSRNSVAAYVDRNPDLRDMPDRNRNKGHSAGGWRNRPTRPVLTPTAPAKPPASPVAARQAQAPAPAQPTIIRKPHFAGKALQDLKANDCRWPGEHDPSIVGGFGFCAAMVESPGSVYCAYHARLCGSGYTAERAMRR